MANGYDNLELNEGEMDLGTVVEHWEVDEYPHYLRSKWWFYIAGAVAALLILYAVATANFGFAIIILMIGVITLVTSMKAPDKVDVSITDTGMVIGDHYYEFKTIKHFSIVYDPPHAKWLYLDFVSPLQPMLAVPLEDADPSDVREALLPYCLENLERSEERLIDSLRRTYKL